MWGLAGGRRTQQNEIFQNLNQNLNCDASRRGEECHNVLDADRPDRVLILT